MIGYFTDNNVSQSVMKAFSRSGVKVSHIKNFPFNKETPSIFYGILRGSGVAMRYQNFRGIDYIYVDNGYFDAVYMNQGKKKDMSGTYRIVKNDMIEPIDINPIKTASGSPRVLMLPPTPYTAFMYDTTPEDWNLYWGKRSMDLQCPFAIRGKQTDQPLEEQLKNFDAVLAFNSMGVMKAVEMGKAVYTTHGVIRNSDMVGKCVPYYDIEELKNFYEPKQFTLEEIADRGIGCLQ